MDGWPRQKEKSGSPRGKYQPLESDSELCLPSPSFGCRVQPQAFGGPQVLPQLTEWSAGWLVGKVSTSAWVHEHQHRSNRSGPAFKQAYEWTTLHKARASAAGTRYRRLATGLRFHVFRLKIWHSLQSLRPLPAASSVSRGWSHLPEMPFPRLNLTSSGSPSASLTAMVEHILQ